LGIFGGTGGFGALVGDEVPLRGELPAWFMGKIVNAESLAA